MIIDKKFVLRSVAGEYVIIPVGKTLTEFNGVIRVNETGAFLWRQLQIDTDRDRLIKAMTEEYDIDAETAARDVDAFVAKLKRGGILSDG